VSNPVAPFPLAAESVWPLPPKERCDTVGCWFVEEEEGLVLMALVVAWVTGSSSSPPISKGDVHLDPGSGEAGGQQLQGGDPAWWVCEAPGV